MATMTIAQALQSNDTGIIIADSPANIGAALSNAALVARVAQFTMSGNGAAWASLATQLANLGSRFSNNGFRLTVRDSVAMLSDPANAAGLGIATVVAVFDTADHLLAIAGTPLAARAGSTLLSASASLTLAQLITLESETAFSVLPGKSITLADSAANLLSLSPAQNRPSIKAFKVTVDSTVDIGDASTLLALQRFSVASDATLTVAGSAAVMTDPSLAGMLATYAAMPRTVVSVADALANLLANASDIARLAQTVTGLTTAMTDVQTLTVAQLAAAATLPHFGVAQGAAVFLVDTVANLIGISPSLAALPTLIGLNQNSNVDVAQLASLVALPNFDRAGRSLTVTDTLAHLGSLTPTEQAAVTDIAVRDTVAHLLAASGMPDGTTGVVALLDLNTYTVAQAQALLGLAGSLSLEALGSATALLISDTTAHLTAAGATLAALQADGPVSVTSTDGGPLPGSVVTAAVAASMVTSTAGILVSDTGPALSAFASQIFGHGFASIAIASGVFAGTAAQLLDPTLHFGGQSNSLRSGNLVLRSQNVAASAQLLGATTASVAQLTALSILPNFSLASGATLTVSDTIAALAGASVLVGGYATSVQVGDSDTVTAAGAAALADIRSAIGVSNFSLNSHVLTVGDDAANIANPVNAAGIALAGAVQLSVPSIATAAQATTLLGLGGTFSVNGMGLTIVDTAARLATLTGLAATLNGWGAQVQLSTDATLSVSGAQALLGFAGFSVGSHRLTLADTGAALLAGGAAGAESVASTVLLTQPATVTIAAAGTLLGLHGFSANGQAVTVADTPAHLAAMPGSVSALATTATIVARTVGNAADYTLNAAQLGVLQATPNLSMSGFVNAITLSDTAPTLAGLASAFSDVPSGSLLTRVVPVLSADATVSASVANALAHLPNFGLGGYALTVRDNPANLLAGGVVAGIAIAANTGIDAPATVSAAMATGLAALHGFAADGNPLTIADTPAALLALSPSVAALAANERIVPRTEPNASSFVLSAAQLQTLAAIPNLILAGPIAVSDTAANLVLLEVVFAAAAPGSAILAAGGASNAVLSANATVSAASMHALAALSGFGLGGHSLTVSDTPSALLAAPPPDLGLATGVVLTAVGAPWTVSAGAAEALVSLPHFGAGPGFAVSDSVGNLLAPSNADGLAGASSVTIGADVTVSATQATALHGIAGFTVGTHHLTINNGAAGLANLDSGTAAMATAIQLSGSGIVTVAQFQTIAALPHFSLNGNTLSVVDTAAHLLVLSNGFSLIASTALTSGATATADQAQALSALPRFSAAAGLTVADTAAHLLNPADAAGLALAGTIILTADATVTAAQAMVLDRFGIRFGNGGHTLTLADTPSALATGAGWGSIAGQISGYALSAHAGPWTVSAAAATALEALPNFDAGPGFVVSDSVGNLLAPANASGLAGAASVALSADSTVAAWQAQALHAIAGFGLGGHQLTISQGVRGLANLDAGTAAMATAIQLSDSGFATVARLHALQGLTHFSLNDNTISVIDTADNLLTLNSGNIGLASAIMLQANATLTAAQAEALAELPGFTVGVAHLSISDTVANLLHVTGSGSLPDDWAGELIASTITLTADATVTADQAEELAMLGGRLVLGGHTLTVIDSAAHLLNAADAAGLALAASVGLSGNEAGLTAAQATALTGLVHFSKGANSVTVMDTAGNLQFTGNAAGISLADHVKPSAPTSLSASAAAALIDLANFENNGTAPLSIADTLAHLLRLSSVTLSHNNTVLQATSIGLSEDATATVAQMTALAALPEFAHFGLNGHTLTAIDSGRRLAAYTPNAGAMPTAVQMVGDATLTAARANALAALGTAIGDNLLTVSDTPTALLSGGNASGIALAGALALSADAAMSTAQAELLFGNPLFSTGGHHATIQGTAAGLLGLSEAIDADATTLSLVGNETVTVATLLGLTQLGIKFSLAGHTLTVADTGAHLRTLNRLETNLASAEVLNADAIVTAASAEILAALPNFSRGSGITLTIVDSVANLLGLSAGAQAIATAEHLASGANVTLTVAQALGLAGLSGFSNTGATVVVDDTIAHLGLSGWQSVATSYNVTDSVSNLVANAGGVLLTHANAVVLLGDAVIDTTTIGTLAEISNFTRGNASLVVADSPDAIAAHAAQILAVASSARIVASTAISAAEAEQLVGLSGAGKLTFAGANHLVVADTYAHLSDAGNAAGVALASVIDIADNAANLIAATSHDWGSIVPFYVLTANGTVTGAQATALAGLGGHYSNGGFVLTMADTAAATIANGAALTSLVIQAAVSDSIANIDSHVAGLLALGVHLASVTPTDIGAVSADAAAGLHLLATVLAGAAVAVTDSASAVVADSSDLLALGSHLGTITLTDSSPVAVAVATGLLPVLAHLAGGTSIAVSDTGAHIAAQASGLASLGADLGSVTLSDGTATNAAIAAALVPVQAHLGSQTLTVSDTAAAIDTASAGLATMQADSRISAIAAPNETVAHILAHETALTDLGATATILDTAAHVNAALDGLEALHTMVISIGLTDGTTPTLTVTVAQLSGDSAVLASIATAHHVVVSDTAAHIQSDLSGGSSVILAALSGLTGIVAIDAGTVTLTESHLLAAGVDDGAGSAMALFSGGTLVVTGVAAADVGLIAGLGVPPASMSVFDSAGNIQADLQSGSSDLVTHRALISVIAVGGPGTITLTEAEATAAHVDDGVGSVFAKLTGASLAVTDVAVAQVGTVANLPVAPASMAVNDTAAHVQADLIAGGSHILGHLGTISGIAVNDAGTISLTVAQIEAAGVDDGAGSALSKTTGEILVVTGATVADIGTLARLSIPPDSFAIADTAAHLEADLQAGASSAILAHRAQISGIAVTPSGTIVLTAAQALYAGVVVGAGTALSLMTGATLVVTGVELADMARVLGASVMPDHITVSDTAAHIQADLASGTSALVAQSSAISAIAVAPSGMVILTVAEIEAAGVDDGAGSVLDKMSGETLHVIDAAIADIGTLLGLGVPPSSIAISDTAANLDADLTSGSPTILAQIAHIGAIALTDIGTPALAMTLAQRAAVSTALDLISTPYSLAISDTAADIQADLASGSSALLAHLGAISGITVSDAGTITLTQAQVLAAHVDDGAGSVFSLLSGGGLAVSNVDAANIGTVLGLGFAPSSIAVRDTAAHIEGDLVAGTSAILGNLGAISGIAVAGGGAIHLTYPQILVTGVDDGAGSALSKLTGGTPIVSDVVISEVATVLALGVPPISISVTDTASNIQADLMGGVPVLVAERAHVSAIVVSGSSAITLTVAQAEANHVDDGAGSVFAKMTGGTLTISDATVADLDTLLALGVPPSSIDVSDTAAHIQTDLASGSSHILAHLAVLHGIAVSPADAITLMASEVLAAQVDDGAGSVFSLLSGGTLDVTDVAVAQVASILALPFAASSFTMTDTAAHLQADLTGGSSAILANLGSIVGIAIAGGGTIHLTEAEIQAAGVDDGSGSALTLLSGGSVEVTGVPIADIATMLALGVPPTSIAVSDTAANIEADLTGGSSVLLAHRTVLSTILANDSGTIHLTVAQATTAHIDDGAGSVFSKMSGETLVVTGALVSDVGNLGALIVAPTGLNISDTAAHIQADLASGSSHLAANVSIIGAITVSDAGTITLTETQLRATHVDDGAGSVLALTSGGSLAVTDVLAADIRTVVALGVVPDSFAISDTAAHIQADLVSGSSAILAYLGVIPSIAISPAGTIALTETQVLGASIDDGAGSALFKMTGLTLNVTEVPIADIATILALGVPPDSIAVSDTAAHIQADLVGGASELLAHRAAIGSIALSDDGTIELTVAQIEAVHVDDGAGSVYSKVVNGTSIVTDALVSDIETMSGLNVRPQQIHVSDTAAHIQADLIAGGSSHILGHPGLIDTIIVNDGGTVTLTESQIRAAGVDDYAHAPLVKLTGGTIAAIQVLAADVGIVAGLRAPPNTISVSDTAAHIQADLIAGSSHILANIGLVVAIAVNPAGTITLTEAQLLHAHIDDGAGSALSLMSGQTLTVTGVPVADIATVVALGVPPDHIVVSDTAAHIQADLVSGMSVILGNLASISGIGVSPAGTITLTDTQVQVAGVDDGGGSALALMTGAMLVVTGVPVTDIATIVGLGVAPAHITVVDSEANLIADLTGGSSVIAANSSAITSVTPTDASLTVTDATALYNALLGVATLVESGLTITGSAADLLTAQSSVPAMLTAAHAVTMDDNPTGLTAAQATTLSGILGAVLGGGQTMQIVDTAAHLILAGNAAGIALATDVALDSGILAPASLATTLAGLHAFNAGAQAIWIQDTVAHLLDSGNAAGLAIAVRVFPPADVTVTAAQLAALAGIAHFETNSHAITVTGNAAAIAALSQGALGLSSLAAVTDTSAHVSTSLTALQSAVTGHAHTMTISLSDGVLNTVSITVTSAAYSANRGTIDTITTNGTVLVVGTAAQLAAIRVTLAADTVVGQVAVTDSAANILSNLTALNAIGTKFDSATITDATVSATLVSSLLTIPNLNAGSLTISDTGAQLATAIQSSGAPGLAFLNAHTVTLSADSVVTASQALSLQSLTSLSKNGHLLTAWDTASHLIDSVDGYLAAVSAGSIDAVYLKTVGGTATVSAATASALFSIPHFSKNNPDSSSNVLTVSDTAAHLESSFTSLNVNKTAVSGIVVSATTTVTDAVYAHMLTLGATTAFGANLTVRDTAANIVANAPTQLSGSPSITPSTWALSGSATVSIASAAYLGGLSGFSPGAFTLTLGADGSASVANANNLGALGSTLRMGGHVVHVAGTVASVSALTNPAKAIATPDITDTFAHVATLALGGGLLGGTITVTDNASPTVVQAAAFLAILRVGGNGGIPIANVSFGGHIEAITDTLANVQTLTGSAGWTSNVSVRAAFSLVVADTVANLINGANTAALSAMAGTTLSSNQTTTAANAESLNNLTSTIHFGLGGHTVTIQDTAANILNLANADGEALATAWNLSANDTVSAADAEILLAAAKFGVNGHTLTIADSSDNLLDGILSGIVSGFAGIANVHVQLAAAETLDAQTAAALVALPGFTNNGDLSIQDSSDYLLNAANHTAEADASSVTLVGDETVSVATAVSLAAVPNFTLGSSHLVLASNDYANAAALVAIGNFDTGFDANGHTLTMTQDALSLTPAEYNALQSDNVVLNGHALSALATGIVVTSGGGTVHVAGNGVDGATLNVYASSGTSLSHTTGVSAAFDASASEGSIGNGVVVTETVGASAATSESAPIIALEKTVITDAATAASAIFAGSGSVQVGAGEYLNVYTTANAPVSPANPYLVYDATAHTLSLDISGYAPLVLVTLGGATHPTSLDPSEIIVQHFV
jgi:hypothetical protein